jgi:hypothetical protein
MMEGMEGRLVLYSKLSPPRTSYLSVVDSIRHKMYHTILECHGNNSCRPHSSSAQCLKYLKSDTY